jgi:hypothetical protein
MRMMTWSSGNPNVKSKSPLPGAPKVKVFFMTLPLAPLLEQLVEVHCLEQLRTLGFELYGHTVDTRIYMVWAAGS